MTILKVTVEDEQADNLRKLLQEVPFVKNIEEENLTDNNKIKITESSYERIKKILDEAKGKNLFKDIEDPSEWQREIRKEWERDF
ncbi:MAG: hypothetical protein JWQ63_4435 [Mucilaginibacter sp.]|jgi:hypothetical protein|nr:hypothetical protein [Mucilaginibacter sp.]